MRLRYQCQRCFFGDWDYVELARDWWLLDEEARALRAEVRELRRRLGYAQHTLENSRLLLYEAEAFAESVQHERGLQAGDANV